MASVKLTDVKKVYDNKVTAVHDFNLEVRDGEPFVLHPGEFVLGSTLERITLPEVDPDFVRLRTFVAKPGTPMGEKVLNGEFVSCTDEEKVAEIRRMLEQVEGCSGMLVSDHIVNLLEDIRGSLKTQKRK